MLISGRSNKQYYEDNKHDKIKQCREDNKNILNNIANNVIINTELIMLNCYRKRGNNIITSIKAKRQK